MTSTISHANMDKTIDFCANAFDSYHPEDRAAVLDKMASALNDNEVDRNSTSSSSDEDVRRKLEALRESLTPEEKGVLDFIRARKAIRTEETLHIDSFTTNVIDGLAPHLERGHLTLVEAIPQMKSGAMQMVESVG